MPLKFSREIAVEKDALFRKYFIRGKDRFAIYRNYCNDFLLWSNFSAHSSCNKRTKESKLSHIYYFLASPSLVSRIIVTVFKERNSFSTNVNCFEISLSSTIAVLMIVSIGILSIWAIRMGYTILLYLSCTIFLRVFVSSTLAVSSTL